MALLFRTRLVSFSCARPTVFALPNRGYAAANVSKKKGQTKQPSTLNPLLSLTSSPVPAKKRKSVANQSVAARPVNESNVPTPAKSAPSPPPDSEQKQKSIEEQIAEVDLLINMSRHQPKIDPWGQMVRTLDVQIPHAISLNPFKRRDENSISTYKQIKYNLLNNAKNAVSMYRLAKANGFPGTNIQRSFFQKYFYWPIAIFQSQSTTPDAWIAGIREEAFDTYKAVNKAISSGDERAVKRLTLLAYQDTSLKLLRKRKGPESYVWRIHEDDDATAARVLSIRAIEGNLAKSPPKVGNRLMVHALVKFDTKQSLQVYSKTGKLLSSVQPKNVVEYLVLEKRMWYEGPWMIREQMFETVGKHV